MLIIWVIGRRITWDREELYLWCPAGWPGSIDMLCAWKHETTFHLSFFPSAPGSSQSPYSSLLYSTILRLVSSVRHPLLSGFPELRDPWSSSDWASSAGLVIISYYLSFCLWVRPVFPGPCTAANAHPPAWKNAPAPPRTSTAVCPFSVYSSLSLARLEFHIESPDPSSTFQSWWVQTEFCLRLPVRKRMN